MLAPECRRLWDASLHRIVQAEDGSGPGREETARTLHRIDDLRQRSRLQARPVIHLELDAIHADIARLTRRLSPALADLYEPSHRFPDARFDELLSHVPRRPGGVQN